MAVYFFFLLTTLVPLISLPLLDCFLRGLPLPPPPSDEREAGIRVSLCCDDVGNRGAPYVVGGGGNTDRGAPYVVGGGGNTDRGAP